MRHFNSTLKLPAIISSGLVLPFMILELVNRRQFHEAFPVPLFGLMWLLPVAFIVILTPILRNLRAGNALARPASLLLRAGVLVLIAWLWSGLLLDQMPCFMGVQNCD
jgi:hypothetical protein